MVAWSIHSQSTSHMSSNNASLSTKTTSQLNAFQPKSFLQGLHIAVNHMNHDKSQMQSSAVTPAFSCSIFSPELSGP